MAFVRYIIVGDGGFNFIIYGYVLNTNKVGIILLGLVILLVILLIALMAIYSILSLLIFIL